MCDKNSKKCSVENCAGPATKRGYCNKHYLRLIRHGDPEGGGTGRGVVMDWLHKVAIPHNSDECLIFPFSRAGSGHARINSRKRSSMAHRYVLECVSGPPPSKDHEGCHSCGNGHLGCVNPRHLYWGTRQENVLDRKKHGGFTAPPILSGENNPRAKLCRSDVDEIRDKLSTGQTMASIAEEYSVSTSLIFNIKSGKAWAT